MSHSSLRSWITTLGCAAVVSVCGQLSARAGIASDQIPYCADESSTPPSGSPSACHFIVRPRTSGPTAVDDLARALADQIDVDRDQITPMRGPGDILLVEIDRESSFAVESARPEWLSLRQEYD